LNNIEFRSDEHYTRAGVRPGEYGVKRRKRSVAGEGGVFWCFVTIDYARKTKDIGVLS